MELFTRLFGDLLIFVYHCFDRVVIHGYLSGLSRPEQVVHFVRQVMGIPVVSKEVLSRRTDEYRNWVEAFARSHNIPTVWAEKGLRKEDHVLPALRRLEKRGRMVKELDLFESNHGCGLNALSQENIRNGRNKTLHGPELVRNVFPGPFGAGRAIAHGFSMFEYFDLTT
jgi:hypothetical protein